VSTWLTLASGLGLVGGCLYAYTKVLCAMPSTKDVKSIGRFARPVAWLSDFILRPNVSPLHHMSICSTK
jgi:hypothetical protein